ncbi:ParA family protein [Halomarina litorea]|uniref:ParA family protein n=1 Tax=Halomarina litorea TaxID=2961595 RepID=UPI0020C45448|nr:AAA family ATPase [Halomarina sp. BCD28]
MSSCALVGAVGGAGTTRLTLELAALLVRDGRDVAVLDAAYATQGLADYVPRRIDPDITALALSEDPLADGLVDLDAGPGRLAVCPARAPFERLARAKGPDAARRFERLVAEAEKTFDRVLVDTPPVAANQSVAAVTAADRVVLVVPDSQRGCDALPRQRDRLADLGVSDPRTLFNWSSDPPADATAAVPTSDTTDPASAPVCATGGGTFPAAVALAAEELLDVTPDIEFEDATLRERLAGFGSS